MPLEFTIYNRQTQTSKSGKQYIGYAVAFKPGQRGAISATAEVPPFYGHAVAQVGSPDTDGSQGRGAKTTAYFAGQSAGC